MLRVAEISRIEDLAAHRQTWSDLHQRTRNATFFQTLDWLELYWRHYGHGQQLRTLLVYDNADCLGILPLVIREETTRLGTFRVLTYPLHDWGTFFGPIGGSPTATLLAGLQHVARTERDWDLLDLRWIDASGCDHDRTPLALEHAGFPCRQQAWGESAAIRFQGTWEDYWHARGKSLRDNVLRLARRMEREGEVAYLRFRPPPGAADARLDLFDACVEVARRGWQAQRDDGTTLCSPTVHDFLRELHVRAATAGMLDVNLLTLAGQPIAFGYNYHCRGRVCGLRMGYDRQFQRHGPGNVLLQRMIADSFQRGDTHHDFGICYLDAKRHWTNALERSYRYTHYPLSFSRVQLLRAKNWLIDRWYGGRHVVCARIG